MSYKMLGFHCTECKHKFEELVEKDELPECPGCKSKETEKDQIQSHNPRHVSWSLWTAGN